MNEFSFVTDTSTLCVFDTASLKHRLDDECDWWSIPEDELQEVNHGNVAFIGLGTDGRFDVRLQMESPPSEVGSTILLNCPSGRVFFGAGEEVTADGLEPEAVRGGAFVDVTPGTYRLVIQRIRDNLLAAYLSIHDGPGFNSFDDPVRV